MTVERLIELLSTVEDKTLEVTVYTNSESISYPVMGSELKRVLHEYYDIKNVDQNVRNVFLFAEKINI